MKGTTPLLYRLQIFPASTRRRLQPPDLQATTWRKLPLPSFPASTERRLRPPFLAPSCHPDKKNIAEPVDLSNTKPCTLCWYDLHSDHCQIFSVVNTVTSSFCSCYHGHADQAAHQHCWLLSSHKTLRAEHVIIKIYSSHHHHTIHHQGDCFINKVYETSVFWTSSWDMHHHHKV